MLAALRINTIHLFGSPDGSYILSVISGSNILNRIFYTFYQNLISYHSWNLGYLHGTHYKKCEMVFFYHVLIATWRG